MAWRQFIMQLGALDSDAVEAVLTKHGALAVTYCDAADNAVLEPLPGETPLWSSSVVTALFDENDNLNTLLADLQQQFGVPAISEYRIESLEDRQWEREWLKDFKAMRFGQRLWVCPTGMHADSAGAIEIFLDPGLAFGTGTHPTTAMCLEWLDTHPPSGLHMIDYGCGSGVLAIAALKLGAEHALAVDIDPQALTATRDNAERNGVSHAIAVAMTETMQPGRVDLLAANILAGPLEELAGRFATLLRVGGQLILSGILEEQAPPLLEVYRPHFSMTIDKSRDGWVLLHGQRRDER